MNRPTPRNKSFNHTRWTREMIENARQAGLASILAHNGYLIRRLPNGAVQLPGFIGLIIHHNRWIWKNQHLQGNTIDFFVVIEGKTFDEAMNLVQSSPPQHVDEPNDQDDDL